MTGRFFFCLSVPVLGDFLERSLHNFFLELDFEARWSAFLLFRRKSEAHGYLTAGSSVDVLKVAKGRHHQCVTGLYSVDGSGRQLRRAVDLARGAVCTLTLGILLLDTVSRRP